MSKKSKEPVLTIAGIRACVKQLRAAKPAALPKGYMVDLLIKDRGWFRFTNFAVFQIEVVHDELTFDTLSEESEIMIRKEALAQLEEIKKSGTVLKS